MRTTPYRLLIFLLPTLLFSLTLACDCPPVTQYCQIEARSDVIASGLVTRTTNTESAVSVSFRVRESYKGNFHSGNELVFLTPSNASTCGVTFQRGSYYVVSLSSDDSGTLTTNQCHLHEKYLTLSEDLKVWLSSDDLRCPCIGNEDCGDQQFCVVTPYGCPSNEQPGYCAPIPEAFTADCGGVCGCDGNTYCNAGYAGSHSVSVIHEGACCSNFTCPLQCEFGYTVSQVGTDCTCECRPPPQCPDISGCTKECPNGHLSDSNGCAICACRDCQPGTTRQVSTCVECWCNPAGKEACRRVENCEERSCSTDTGEYKHGENWKIDACTTCQCQDGSTICRAQSCPVLTCNSTYQVEGECCARCAPNCEGVRCAQPMCPYPVLPVGSCCPICPNDCTVDNQVHQHNTTWIIVQEDKCDSCYCFDGSFKCSSIECPSSQCPDGSEAVSCFMDPCDNQQNDCPTASRCEADYCGGCNAKYFDEHNNQICKSSNENNNTECPLVRCNPCTYGFINDSQGCQTCECLPPPPPTNSTNSSCPPIRCPDCPYGYAKDGRGCQTCRCLPPPNNNHTCPDGSQPVNCISDPCQNQREQCPNATRCEANYCGGCNAKYFDRNGRQICVNSTNNSTCPPVHCNPCSYGYVKDDRGCQTCRCLPPPNNNTCPDGSQPVNCFINPCDNQNQECPSAYRCQPNYCGGCNAKYFDQNGRQICSNSTNNSTCPPVHCNPCAHGYVKDDRGCQTCRCLPPPPNNNTCPDGSEPVNCFEDPCQNQREQCPNATRCEANYCGGCNAKYFDQNGRQICQPSNNTCVPLDSCSKQCQRYQIDPRGCKICECVESSPPQKWCFNPQVEKEGKQCYFEGQYHFHGEEWKTPDCRSCICRNGSVMCIYEPCNEGYCPTECGRPDCIYGLQKDEKGCPFPQCECAECAEGTSWTDDGCLWCECQGGRKHCTPQADCYCKPLSDLGCGDVNCPFGNEIDENGCLTCQCRECNPEECSIVCNDPIYVDGECCPRCPFCKPLSDLGCTEECPFGYQEDANGCLTCTCREECIPENCPRCENPIWLQDECCPFCNDCPSIDCALDCILSVDSHGCPICECLDCSNQTECPQLDCPTEDALYLKGKCCPECPVMCAAVLCPKPDCDAFYLPPNTCCPICTEPVCVEGEYRVNGCEHCTCVNGFFECFIQDCAPPPCSNPVYVEGQCCPVCECGPDCLNVCEFGYKIDERGCPTCECLEPPQCDCELYCSVQTTTTGTATTTGTTTTSSGTGNTTGNTGNGTGNTGNGTGNTGNGTGNTGNATGNTGNATGNTGNGTGNTGNATGNTGNATGNTGNGTGDTGNATGNTGNATGDTGNATGNTGNATGNATGNGSTGNATGNATGNGSTGQPHSRFGVRWDESCSLCNCQTCPEVMCLLFCENGYVLDERGCNTCTCIGGSTTGGSDDDDSDNGNNN